MSDERLVPERTAAAGTGLPAPPRTGPLIGRDTHAGLLTDMVAAAAGQVVSVVGLGGVGKTWLVADVVRRAAPGRVVWLPATAVRSRWLVAAARARAAAPVGHADRHAVPVGSDSVLVVDGAERGDEHVLDELLDRFPGMRVVVTSRAPLGAARELVLPLPGLDVEHASQVLRSQVRRARVDGDDPRTTAELCALLDGVPAALRWAATLCTARSPRRIVSHMRDSGLALWWSDAGDGAAVLDPIRHTLRQLAPRPLRVLRAAAALGTPWSADECAAVAGIGVTEAAALVDELLTMGLVRLAGDAGEPRFGVLNLVRAVLSGADIRRVALRSGTSG